MLKRKKHNKHSLLQLEVNYLDMYAGNTGFLCNLLIHLCILFLWQSTCWKQHFFVCLGVFL